MHGDVGIEFDPDKDRKNRAKHGVGLALAALIFEHENLVAEFPDARMEYGEDRLTAYGRVAGRAVVCVYTWRGQVRRIISLRKANGREQSLYFAK